MIDLGEPVSSTIYPPTFAQRARTALAHQHCMFPHCDRAASPVVIHIDSDGGVMTNCDADHIVPYRPGQITSTEDLAPLCRTHHRMKTLKGWTYTKVFDRVYLWTSPFKTVFLVTPDATIELPVPARPERTAQQMWAIVHPERLGLKEPDPDQYPGVAEWNGHLPDG